jgi:hypothetical protein
MSDNEDRPVGGDFTLDFTRALGEAVDRADLPSGEQGSGLDGLVIVGGWTAPSPEVYNLAGSVYARTPPVAPRRPTLRQRWRTLRGNVRRSLSAARMAWSDPDGWWQSDDMWDD